MTKEKSWTDEAIWNVLDVKVKVLGSQKSHEAIWTVLEVKVKVFGSQKSYKRLLLATEKKALTCKTDLEPIEKI